MANSQPTVLSPTVLIRRWSAGGGGEVDFSTLVDAQCLSVEQNSGATPDKAIIRLPTKRLEYFDNADAGWTFSHFDQVWVTLGGSTLVFGYTRNWIREWDGNNENVQITVLGPDEVSKYRCRWKYYGKWDATAHAVPASTKNTVTSARIVFNEGGAPDFNKCETEYSHILGNQRFWGSGNLQDADVGWWNPINMIKYALHSAGFAGSPYKDTVTYLGTALAGIDGWSGVAAGGDLTYQKPFPEVDIDGMTIDGAMEKILWENGGLKHHSAVVPGTSLAGITVFKTYAPYTASQVKRVLHLKSTGSTLAMSANNVQRGRVNKDDSKRATHVIGYGNNLNFVGTIRLHPGWDPNLTDAVMVNPALISRDKDNADYDATYEDVFRRWIVPTSTHDMNSLFGLTAGNSTAKYPFPYSQEGHKFNSGIRMTYAPNADDDDKRANFRPLLSYVTYLVGGADNQSNVRKVDLTWQLLPDALGVRIGGTGAKIEDQLYIAHTLNNASGGTINGIYITAAIAAQARLTASQVDAKVATGSVPDVEVVINRPALRYEARAISMGDYTVGGNRRIVMEIPGSGIVATTLSAYASINDQSGLDDITKNQYEWLNTSADTARVEIPFIETVYDFGDVITSIYDRGIEMESVVVGRKWDFQAPSTTLFISDERYKGGPSTFIPPQELRYRAVRPTGVLYDAVNLNTNAFA